MKIFNNILSIQKETLGLKNLNFVPTMGGLHKAHRYLIKKAKKMKGKVIVSIYINPKQFESKKDFAKYPRDLKKDLSILRKLNVNYVFLPNTKEIYLYKVKKKIYQDTFSKKLCGKYRKNHFKGVLNIVNRFLEILKPRRIILGQKDFQQLYLIKKHIIKNKIKTKTIPCKIIREVNGVACSTRNKNLNNNEIKIASSIFKYLKKEKEKIKSNKNYYIKTSILKNKIKLLGVTKLQYLKILNTKSLKENIGHKNLKIFVAYYLGKTRLIDNI